MYAIVPAGGAGSRLWPLSRRSRPKFLLDLEGGGQSMIRTTVSRLSPVVDGVLVVTGAAHAPAVEADLAGTGAEIVAEPSPRDSMAAIGLAAAIVHHRHGDTVVGSFAADHAITRPDVFHEAVHHAVALAEAGYVTTIGITPDGPSTAYGYIEAGEALGGAGRHVTRFEEKPDAQRAAAYLRTGQYYWNAGMFVMRTGVLFDALRSLHPDLAAGLQSIAAAWDTPDREEVLAEHWPTLPKMVIDRAVAEPLAEQGRVAVVPAEMGWTDIGDYEALAELAPSPAFLAIDSPHTYATANRPVVVVGVPGAVVIETDQAILVTTQEHAQDVRRAVDELNGEHEWLR